VSALFLFHEENLETQVSLLRLLSGGNLFNGGNMDIVAALRTEERKLEVQLGGIRGAIQALNGHVTSDSSDRGSKLKGKKLSAAHRRAIALGIAKSKARKAGSK
jgi:hypothetical protein